MTSLIACTGMKTEVQGVPTIIRLLPLGQVSSQKGNFTVDKESYRAMKAEFERRGLDIVIDYEHQTLENTQAPAGGWIKELLLEEDAISAKVEWTPKAKDYLANKEYRYLSPVVLVRKRDKKACTLHSVALTNTPAIDGMFPIMNKFNLSNDTGGEEQMDLAKMIALLKLPEEATETEVMERLTSILDEVERLKEKGSTEMVANKTICGLLGVAEDAKTEDVSAAIVALKQPATHVLLELKALKDHLAKRDAEETVALALKAGKITPAMKEWAMEYALKDAKGFASFAEKSPTVVPMGAVISETDGIENRENRQMSEVERKILKATGVNPEDVQKYGKAGV